MWLWTSPFQVDTLEKEPREPGYDLEVHWHQKWVKYGEAWGVEGITFMPIVMSSLGSWEEGVIQAIKPWPHHTYFLNVNESGEVLCMWILSWAHFGIMKVFTWLDPFPETVGPKSLICQMNMFKNSFTYEEYPSSLVILNVIYLIDI